jgi:NTP pyrophosphatase (non-canonical NTP hydrolase)
MDFREYQTGTAKTAIYPGAGLPESYPGLSYVALGLVGEAGEVAGKIKKIARDDGGVIGDVARAKIADELADVLWYVSQAATQLGLGLEDIARANLAKLADRQARGVLRGSGDTR